MGGITMGTEKIIIGVVKDELGKIVTATCTDEKGARLALAHIFNEKKKREEEKRRNAKTCRNCRYAIIERRFGALAPQTCQCSLRTHGKYNQWHKQMRLSQTCELFKRVEAKED